MKCHHPLVRALCAALLLAGPGLAQRGDRVSTVGVPVRIQEIVLPGSELEVRDIELDTPIALRIAGVYPHGDAFRYDIEYYGLEAGTFDLRDYLRRVDGSTTDGLPRLSVQIDSVLSPGRVEPGRPPSGELPPGGGYRAWMAVAALAWLAGLWAILKLGRKEGEVADGQLLRPMTLAERLQPLVKRAVRGELSHRQQADLELILIAYWRKKLGLEASGAAQAMAELKAHPEAGPLLSRLEEWLHRDRPAGEVDVDALLRPYEDLPADALGELPSGLDDDDARSAYTTSPPSSQVEVSSQ